MMLTNWMLGGAAATLMAVITIEEVRLWSVRADLKNEKELHDTCKLNKRTAQDSVRTLRSGLTRCNSAVDALVIDGLAKDAELARAAQKNVAARNENKRRAAEAENTPASMNAWYKALYGVTYAK